MLLIGGHRGCGENLYRRSRGPSEKPATGIRENTLRSFAEAAKLGAHFIEFDVQVTSDGVAVIFHDDYIIHGEAWAAERLLVRQLTAEQFARLGPGASVPLMRWFRCSETREALQWDAQWECDTEDAMPTLEQVFDALPPHVGFNIEIKLATSSALATTPDVELKRMLDSILPVVTRCQGERPVMLSSFDPDMMTALSRRSHEIVGPHSLWYLTDVGSHWHADPRRLSIAAAIDFARLHGMAGVVIESGALQRDPDAVQSASLQGLSVMTYGVANMDAVWLQQQRALGVRGVIVDDVASAVVASAAQPVLLGPECPLPRTRSDVPEMIAPMTKCV